MKGQPQNVRLLDVTGDDLRLIAKWLRAEHVYRYWGEPDANIRLFHEPPNEGRWRAIIEEKGRKVGVVLWQHPTRYELDGAGLCHIPESVIDIDIMIGEASDVGRGVGTEAIRLVVEVSLSDPAVPFVIAATKDDNLASQRAFAKAGFRTELEFYEHGGRYLLMVRRRQPSEGQCSFC